MSEYFINGESLELSQEEEADILRKRSGIIIFTDKWEMLKAFVESDTITKDMAYDIIAAYMDYATLRPAELPKFGNKAADTVLNLFITALETQNSKYIKKALVNRESGSKGGKASASKRKQTQANASERLKVEANASESKQMQAKVSDLKRLEADNDIDIDNDTDMDNTVCSQSTNNTVCSQSTAPPTEKEANIKFFIDNVLLHMINGYVTEETCRECGTADLSKVLYKAFSYFLNMRCAITGEYYIISHQEMQPCISAAIDFIKEFGAAKELINIIDLFFDKKPFNSKNHLVLSQLFNCKMLTAMYGTLTEAAEIICNGIYGEEQNA